MKKMLAIVFSAALALTAFSTSSFAGNCGAELKAGAKSASKDKKCQKGAGNVFKKLGAQIRTCKAYRKLIRACRKAKRSAKKSCRKTKRSCKKQCKKKKGKAKRRCRRSCRKAKRSCAKQARKTKRACKRAAKATDAFGACKSARQLTRKAAGKLFACAWKHFKKAAGTCARELAANMNNGG